MSERDLIAEGQAFLGAATASPEAVVVVAGGTPIFEHLLRASPRLVGDLLARIAELQQLCEKRTAQWSGAEARIDELEASQRPPLDEPSAVRDGVCYFAENGYVKALVGSDLAEAIETRDRSHPGAKIIEQRFRVEWREVPS